MGNSGRSSTGCGLCRKRKIKCDEGRPGCRKCAQIRKPCPGYPFSIELHIRSDNVVPKKEQLADHCLLSVLSVDRTVHRSQPVDPTSTSSYLEHDVIDQPQEVLQKSRQSSILEVKDESSEGEKHLFQVPPRLSRSISPALKYDVQHQATCFFLNLFSYQAKRLYGVPVLDFLPEMLEHSAQNTAIQQASRAVSRMALADRYSGQDVRLQTDSEYMKALQRVSETMTDESEALKDELITAVWLLGLYEAVKSVLSHGRNKNEPQDLDEEWRGHVAHMRGAMRLLKIRGKTQFTNPRSERIFRVFKAAIQMRLFILNSVDSQDFKSLELDLYKDEHEFLPSETAKKASAFFTKTARHLEATKYAMQKYRLQPQSRNLAAELDQLLYEGECLDAAMLRWSKQEPGWDLMPVRGHVQGTIWALYPNQALWYFYSFWVFLYWLRCLIARIKLYETLIEIVKVKLVSLNTNEVDPSKSTHLESRIESFIRIIQKTADDLIGLTAYALGDVTNTGYFQSAPSGINPGGGRHEINAVAAMQLVIPFKVLLRSPYPLPAQKGAIDLAISHIADGFRRQPVIPEFSR